MLLPVISGLVNVPASVSAAQLASGTLPASFTTTKAALTDKGGQVFNVKAYGATMDGSTDDNTAVQAALTAAALVVGGRAYIPPGLCFSSLADANLPARIEGGGQLKQTAGRRAPHFALLTSAPSTTGMGNITTGFDAGIEQQLNTAEYRVIGSSTLGSPASGYFHNVRASAAMMYAYSSSGHNEALNSTEGRTALTLDYMHLTQAGQGDMVGHNVSGIVTVGNSSATDTLATPALTALNGGFESSVDKAGMGFAEFHFTDNGHAGVSALGLNMVHARTGTVAINSFAISYRSQSGGSTPVTVAYSIYGTHDYGLDCTLGTFTNNAAIALKTGQRIYGDASAAGVFHASAVGSAYVGYTSSRWQINPGVAVDTTSFVATTEIDTASTKVANTFTGSITDPAVVAAWRNSLWQLTVDLPSNPASGVSYVGGQFTSVIPATNAIAQTNTSLFALGLKAAHLGTGAINILAGLSVSSFNLSTGIVSELRGQQITFRNSGAATVTNATGLLINNITNVGTITNTYGIYVGDVTTGTQTNQAYSLYLSDANALSYCAGTFQVDGLIYLAGTTSSFPALKRSSAKIQARLADDSAFAQIQGKLTTDTNATTGLTAGVLAATTNATITITDASGQVYRVPVII